MTEENRSSAKASRSRTIAADLVETIPDNRGLLHWVLASPLLLFLAWAWIDVFAHFSPIFSYWVDAFLGLWIYVFLIVLPLGVGAFYLVSSFPRLFGHAGWDVQPLEAVAEGELYTVRYQYHNRYRAKNSWGQFGVRAAQGWVYIEIAVILGGAVAMVPIFMSVSDFGFGQ